MAGREKCPVRSCPGDGAYAPPGRGHTCSSTAWFAALGTPVPPPDVVALIVARRERYRTAARSAEQRAADTLRFSARWTRAMTAAHAYYTSALAMSALLRDMGVTE